MKILVIGSGGREHALVWKLKTSPLVKEIFCAPGNAGIANLAKCVPIDASDIARLLKFASENGVDLTIVGPDGPLVAGIVDEFQKNGLKIFGPTKTAAQLEASKIFAKEFMKRHKVPTAHFQIFDDIPKAGHFLENLREADFPLVVKADGLCAGKVVVICNSFEEAKQAVQQMLEQKIFKDAGSRVVIEECLKGIEVSILAISDGEDFALLDSAQDHKRIFDDDLGPNTGGMGAYSPTPFVSKELLKEISARVIAPTITGMKKEGFPFKGILYVGLMLTANGPTVLEFNVRFGDPETQAILPRLQNDLAADLLAGSEGNLSAIRLKWDPRFCVSVVVSSGGYPGVYETGKEIRGLESNLNEQDTFIFHAGTKAFNGKVLTDGGRVLGVTALGNTMEEAIKKVYSGLKKFHFEKCFSRRDIGAKALRRTHG